MPGLRRRYSQSSRTRHAPAGSAHRTHDGRWDTRPCASCWGRSLNHGVAQRGTRDLIDCTHEHQCGDARRRPRHCSTAVRIVHDRLCEQWRSWRHGRQCREDTAGSIGPTDDEYLVRGDACLPPGPRCGFENVFANLGVGNIAAASAVLQVPAPQVVHEHDKIPGGLQFARALVVEIKAVACDEPGTSGNKQHCGVCRAA